MANMNPFSRPKKIDWDRLNKELDDALADFDQRNAEQKRLALDAGLGQPGGAEAVAAGSLRLQKAKARLELAKAAIDGATDLEAAQQAADAARREQEADRAAKAALAKLAKLAEEGERVLAPYVAWWPSFLEAWSEAQPHFSTNPRLRDGARGSHPVKEQVGVELTRMARVPGTRPDLLPPGANVRALAFAHEVKPMAKLYAELRDHSWKDK